MRVKILTLLPICLALVLGACGKRAETPAAADAAAPKPPASAAGPRAGSPVAEPAAAMPQLAYAYSAEIEAAADAVPRLVAQHEATCRSAGPALCQVTAMSLTADGGVRAHFGLRAQPEWLQGFRAHLAADAQAVGGRVVKTSAVSEDLSGQLVDTEAALRAKTLLAQRLEGLLANHQGKLSELLDLEKQLSDTQGEIDAARSTLAMMRARVATSEMALDYTAPASFGMVWGPVAQATKGATGVFAGGVGVLISVVAAILPFALLGGLIAWLARRFAAEKGAKGPSRKH